MLEVPSAWLLLLFILPLLMGTAALFLPVPSACLLLLCLPLLCLLRLLLLA